MVSLNISLEIQDVIFDGQVDASEMSQIFQFLICSLGA